MGELEALVLGVVQGLTEFLPVSSSGHLVIAQALLGAQQKGLLFEIVVHVATLGSVLLFYRRRVAELLVGVFIGRAADRRYVAKLALATVPAVIAVLLFGEFLEAQFESIRVVGAGLLLTGAVLWTTGRSVGSAHGDEPGWAAAWWIGCAQAVAILPGVSRSGSTVAAALALGVSPLAAAEFSFLAGSIAIAGAALRSLGELSAAPPGQVVALMVGAAAALLSGIAAIWTFVRLLRNRGFHRFAYYTWTLGLLVLAWSFLR